MKAISTFAILLLALQSCSSPNLIGNWYMANRSGLIEFSITEDSVKTRKLYPDFTPKDKRVQAFAYKKIVKLDDRLLIIYQLAQDEVKFSAMTLMKLTDKKMFQLVWNIEQPTASNIEELVQIHQKDHRPLFGYYVYHEQYTPALKKMKSIDSLPLADFKRYYKIYDDKIKMTKKESDTYNTGYLTIFSYNYQLISQSLYEIGFNPLQSVDEINELYKKYYEDPEVKKMIDQSKL